MLCRRYLISNADLSRSVQEYELTVLGVKKEYTKSSSNKCTKTKIIYIVLEISVRLF